MRGFTFAELRVVVVTSSIDMKLSCRRETARCFLSLNILLRYSRSVKVIRNYTVEYGMCKALLVFH